MKASDLIGLALFGPLWIIRMLLRHRHEQRDALRTKQELDRALAQIEKCPTATAKR